MQHKSILGFFSEEKPPLTESSAVIHTFDGDLSGPKLLELAVSP